VLARLRKQLQSLCNKGRTRPRFRRQLALSLELAAEALSADAASKLRHHLFLVVLPVALAHRQSQGHWKKQPSLHQSFHQPAYVTLLAETHQMPSNASQEVVASHMLSSLCDSEVLDEDGKSKCLG
jgi:hypothetical protein